MLGREGQAGAAALITFCVMNTYMEGSRQPAGPAVSPKDVCVRFNWLGVYCFRCLLELDLSFFAGGTEF